MKNSTVKENNLCIYTRLDNNIKLESSKVYWKLLGKHIKQPTVIKYWISEFPFLHDDDFPEIYKVQKNVTEVRIQSFQ